MDNIAGSPVEGDNFFGRDDVARHLREILNHDDILLLGPRRIGKTSLARAVLAITRQNGWQAIEINVASCIDEKGFLDKLEGELKKAINSLVGKLWDGTQEKLGTIAKRIKSLKLGGFGAGRSRASRHRCRRLEHSRQRTAGPPRHPRRPLADLRG